MEVDRSIAALVAESVRDGMSVRRIRLASSDVVLFKGLVEASNGIAQVYAEPATAEMKLRDRAERTSVLNVVAGPGTEALVDELLRDLMEEISMETLP